MIAVVATIRFDAARTDEALAGAAEVARICRALPGCRRYDIAVPLGVEGEVVAIEEWDDLESFHGHVPVTQAAPELAGWRAVLRGVSATVYTVSSAEAAGTDH